MERSLPQAWLLRILRGNREYFDTIGIERKDAPDHQR